MARPSAAARNYSLTEELERLEQSITLTLQEIDHNFSKSHRIVTASILPLVEQYGDHSAAVWEASKFWKQFFEASANVSLSGYEEQGKADNEAAEEGDEEGNTAADESTALHDDATVDYTENDHHQDVTATPGTARKQTDRGEHGDGEDESMLDEGEITGSTPRMQPTRTARADFLNMESPYEQMKREMKDEEEPPEEATAVLPADEEDSTVLFAQRTARLPDMSMTPGTTTRSRDRSVPRANQDPLLHRVLDKNYRIQATPHKTASRVSPAKAAHQQPHSSHKKPSSHTWRDDSPMSSPEIAMPKLRSEAFMSPVKGKGRAVAAPAPRTPGVSVQTPGTARGKTKDVFGSRPVGTSTEKDPDVIDWDDEEEGDLDLYAGMSPPKTINFALPPSKLLQTPAKQATRQIVDGILMDAGVDVESSEFSPTMAKISADLLDDSF